MRFAGTGAVAMVAGLPAVGHASSLLKGLGAGLSDADVLNFALNLEYLEAEFYSHAYLGKGIPDDLTGGKGESGPTTGGSQVSFKDNVLSSIVRRIYEDEMDHVRFLRKALGPAAVAKPAINLNALGIGFGSEKEFVTLSRAFEDTGVSAYGGAARLISNKDFLEAAAQILAAEAYHAGMIRAQVLYNGWDVPALDAKDIPPNFEHVFPTDSNGLAVIRRADEVAKIVRGPNASGGAFYPEGMNGKIR